MTYDQAQTPRLGQRLPPESPGIRVCTRETIPEVAYTGQMVFFDEESKMLVYTGRSWRSVNDASAGKLFIGATDPYLVFDNAVDDGDRWFQTGMDVRLPWERFNVEWKSPEPSGWIAFPGNGGWAVYGGEWQTPQYRRIGRMVYLRGLIARTALFGGTLMGTLPEGYRPAASELFPATQGGNQFARIDVRPNGEVSLTNAADTSFVSFSGISFMIKPRDVVTPPNPTVNGPVAGNQP